MIVGANTINPGLSDRKARMYSLLLLLAAWGVLFLADIQSLLGEWFESGAYNHGPLVVAFSVFAAWRKRETLSRIPARTMATGYVLIFVLGAIWLLAAAANVQLLRQAIVVAMLSAMILAVYGWKIYRVLIFPMMILFFAVPVWDVLREPLRAMTTFVAYHSISILDVPILRQGITLSVPGGTFAVEKSCSGLNYFLVALMLSTFFVHLNDITGRRRVFFIVFSLVLAVVANWLRVIVIIMIGNQTYMQHPIIDDHVTFGWYFYLVTLVPFFLVGNYLKKLPSLRQSYERDALVHAAPIAMAEVGAAGAIKAGALALMVLAVFPLWYLYMDNGALSGAPDIRPPQINERGWRGPYPQHISWGAHHVGANSEYLQQFTNNQRDLYLYSATYYKQSQGAELIYVKNSLYSKNVWRLQREKRSRHLTRDGQMLPLNKLYLEGNGGSRVIWYWYDVAGRQTDDPLMVKAYEVVGRLTGDSRASVFALAADYKQDPNEAEATMADFLDTVYPHLLSDAID